MTSPWIVDGGFPLHTFYPPGDCNHPWCCCCSWHCDNPNALQTKSSRTKVTVAGDDLHIRWQSRCCQHLMLAAHQKNKRTRLSKNFTIIAEWDVLTCMSWIAVWKWRVCVFFVFVVFHLHEGVIFMFFFWFLHSLLPGGTPEDAVGMLSTAGVKAGVPWQNKEFNLSINIWANVSLFFMQIFGATIRWNLSLVLTNPVKPTVRNAKSDGGNRVSVRDRALVWSIFSCGGQYRKIFSQRDIHERQTFLRSPPAGWWDLFRSPQHGSILACCPKSGERFFAQRPAKWVEFWDCRQKSDTFHKKMVKNTEVLSKNSSGGREKIWAQNSQDGE